MARTVAVPTPPKPGAAGTRPNECQITETGGEAKPASLPEWSSGSEIGKRRPTNRELAGMALIVLFLFGLIAFAVLGPLQPN